MVTKEQIEAMRTSEGDEPMLYVHYWNGGEDPESEEDFRCTGVYFEPGSWPEEPGIEESNHWQFTGPGPEGRHVELRISEALIRALAGKLGMRQAEEV